MTMHNTLMMSALAGALMLGAAACASAPAPELLVAQNTVAQAQRGAAASLAPAQVAEAENTLAAAEQADNGSAQQVHLAYLATRRAEIATARAELRDAQAARNLAKIARDEALADRAAQAEAAREAALAAEAELAAERLARAEAEQLYQQAAQELEEIAEVEQTSRGVVITLSGEVLFATGKAELRPIAKERLDRVAEALSETEQAIVIEGHTDSVGTAEYNQDLSKARADATRTYLIQAGVDPEQIISYGLGESQPVAENATSEGRANNRRVEIIVQRG